MFMRSVQLLLPALIPSWRFFKSVGPSPRIEYLSQDGDWAEVLPRPDHVGFGLMLRRMLWNPVWNEHLYLVSLSERIIGGGTDHGLPELTRRISRRVGQGVPFRLVFVSREGGQIVKAVCFEAST